MTIPTEAAAVRTRARIVREAKIRKVRSGGSPDLTPAELDRVLPAVPCARTRNAKTWGDRRAS